jgi:hydrogenase-4 component F
MLQVIPGSGVLMLVGGLALIGTPPFNIFLSKFYIFAVGLGSGYTWLMAVCLLLLVVVFTAFIRVIASALFGDRPEGVAKGETNWLTLAPGALLIAMILILGVYIPPQLMGVLNAASGLASAGDPVQPVAFFPMRDVLLSLAHLRP